MSNWPGNDREMTSHSDSRLSVLEGLEVKIEVIFVNNR